jgi:hypothetical protein
MVPGEPSQASDACRHQVHHRQMAASGEAPRPHAGASHRGDELLEELARRLRSADQILSALSGDMQAAGASSASERAERARAELGAALAECAELRRRHAPDAGGDRATS